MTLAMDSNESWEQQNMNEGFAWNFEGNQRLIKFFITVYRREEESDFGWHTSTELFLKVT